MKTWTFRTLYVFIVISHERCRIEHWNVTAHPRAPWVWRQVIAATAWSRTPRFWIRDRDASYSGDCVPKAAGIGIRRVLTPVRAPQANSIAERVIGTLRCECCDHMIVRNERHLRCCASTSATTTTIGRTSPWRSSCRMVDHRPDPVESSPNRCWEGCITSIAERPEVRSYIRAAQGLQCHHLPQDSRCYLRRPRSSAWSHRGLRGHRP